MAGFPKRFITARPENYPELSFKLLANPDGALYKALLEGSTKDDAGRAALGAALVEAYAGGKQEAYDVVFDFSTADAALATLENDATPADLRFWLRNAPLEIVSHQVGEVEKNFPRSFSLGS